MELFPTSPVNALTDESGARPWLALYPTDVPADLPQPTCTLLEAFCSTVGTKRDAPFMFYSERTITFGEIDDASTGLAVALVDAGLTRGDRIAAFLQNDPGFAIAQLAAWKIGGIFVSINPMLREQELEFILCDSGARALVILETLFVQIASNIIERTDVIYVATTTPQTAAISEADEWLYRGEPGQQVRVEALERAISRWDGDAPCVCSVDLGDVALIGYTSGTSGRPKGVRTTHANLAYNAEVYRRWMAIGDPDVFVCGTPIFHITGLVAGLALSYVAGTPMVLFHRFDAATFLELTERWEGSSRNGSLKSGWHQHVSLR